MSTVTLPKIEYQELKKKAENYDRIIEVAQSNILMPPILGEIKHIYLKGKSAKKLDRRVEQSLKEYRAGKTKIFKPIF